VAPESTRPQERPSSRSYGGLPPPDMKSPALPDVITGSVLGSAIEPIPTPADDPDGTGESRPADALKSTPTVSAELTQHTLDDSRDAPARDPSSSPVKNFTAEFLSSGEVSEEEDSLPRALAESHGHVLHSADAAAIEPVLNESPPPPVPLISDSAMEGPSDAPGPAQEQVGSAPASPRAEDKLNVSDARALSLLPERRHLRLKRRGPHEDKAVQTDPWSSDDSDSDP
jgi:hypothetical protein